MTDSTAPTATPPGSPAPRKLRFATIDDAIAEADRLADAERGGRLQQLGNWTLGQALGHIATWAEFAHDGYPDSVRAPLPVRLVIHVMRNRILTGGLMPGVRLRNIPDGTLGTAVLPTQEGLDRFRAALRALAATPPAIVNPVFGRLSHEQWIQLNLRHAELHLGFLVPRAVAASSIAGERGAGSVQH